MNYNGNNNYLTDDSKNYEILYPVANILPHCPVMLVLDTSHSMWGQGLSDMMGALHSFYQTLKEEQFMNSKIDIAAVSMGDNLRMLEEFGPFEQSMLPTMQIRPKGDTPMGKALELALEKIREQQEIYRNNGWSSVCPKLVMLSDGKSEDDISIITEAIRQMRESEKLECHIIATGENPNLAVLHAIAGDNVRQPASGEMHRVFAEVGHVVSQVYESEAQDAMTDNEDINNIPEAEILPPEAQTVYLLDGSNIMHWDETRSGITLKYLLNITRHFESAGIPYQVLFDATARYRLPIRERDEYERLLREKNGLFQQVPAGTKADDFLLVLADSNPAFRIITNDCYRDYKQTYSWLRTEKRLLHGMVMGNMIFFPETKLKIMVPDWKNTDFVSYDNL